MRNESQHSLICIARLNSRGCVTRLFRRSKITPPKIVIYSADAKARDYRISEDLLWLERWCPRCSSQIQFAVHRERHHSKPGVPLGNGDKKRAAAFTLCRDQRSNAGRRQRRRSRTLSRREQTRRSERCRDRGSNQRAVSERATRRRRKAQSVDATRGT